MTPPLRLVLASPNPTHLAGLRISVLDDLAYRTTATWLEPSAGSPKTAVLITVTRSSPPGQASISLRDRYRLTMREMEVAELVARGKSSRDIASLLGISSHTARHHVEAVRTKLGVRRAGEVAGVLSGGHAPGS